MGAPRLLLLDEPTTGLDPAARREVWDAVRDLARAGTDVLLTTHYLEEANELAHQVVFIDRGKTVASGPLQELKASLGGDVIEVTVASGDRLAQAASILEQLTGRPAQADGPTRRTSAASTGGSAQLAEAISALARAALPVEEIGLRRPTLDEVFAALTGPSPGTGAPRTDQLQRSEG